MGSQGDLCSFNSVCAKILSPIHLPASVQRDVLLIYYTCHQHLLFLLSSACVPWAVFSVYYLSPVLKSRSCMLSSQRSLVWYLLASLKGAKKIKAGVHSGSITEEIWHMLGQSPFFQVSPHLPYPFSLPAVPSASIISPADEAGVPWATACWAVRTWFIPGLGAKFRVL